MLATSRKLRVRGRINSLTVSIRTSIGPRGIGLPLGTKVDKKRKGFITALDNKGPKNKKMPKAKTKAIAGVKPTPNEVIPDKLP